MKTHLGSEHAENPDPADPGLTDQSFFFLPHLEQSLNSD